MRAHASCLDRCVRTHVIYTKRKEHVSAKRNPSNPQLELAELIGRAARRWHHMAERSFSALRLNHTEARLLTQLDKHGGTATQDTLSNALNVDRSNSGRALSRLESSGMVLRSKDEADARTKIVEITAAGKAAVKEIAQVQTEMAEDLWANLNKSQVREAADLLRHALDDSK